MDVSDLGILAANYGRRPSTWEAGDFNGDGVVDVSDLGILAANYGQGGGSTAFSDDAATISTKEVEGQEPICPAAGAVLILGLMIAVLGYKC